MFYIPTAIGLHVLSSAIWVGGMFFAYIVLRPVAAEQLEPLQRLKLWIACFQRFFTYVWLAIGILPASGYFIIQQNWGSVVNVGWDLLLMQGLGWVMILLFMHVYFVPYRRIQNAVANQDIKAGAAALAQIRKIIAVNLSLGITVTVIASAGRYL